MTLNKIGKPAIRGPETRHVASGVVASGNVSKQPKPRLFFSFFFFCVSLPMLIKYASLAYSLLGLTRSLLSKLDAAIDKEKIQVIVSASAEESKRLSRSRVEVTSKSRAKSNTFGPSSLSRMQTRVRHLPPSVLLNFVAFFLCRFGSGKVVGGVRNVVEEFRANNREC